MKWLSLVRPSDVVKEIAKNQLFAVPKIRAARMKLGRTRTSQDPAKCARFAVESFEQLVNSIGGSRAFEGLDVLELGPGDSLPLGVLSLCSGAKRYIALDRFLGDVDGHVARRLYEETLKVCPTELRRCAPDLRTYSSGSSQVRLIRESVETFAEQGIADVIFSYNVLEHVYDLKCALRSMRSMLRPGGMMVHRVDYSAHDVWRSYAKPLAFLAIPNQIWRMMGSARGTPNRLRHKQVVTMMREAGFATEAITVEEFTSEAVNEIAPFLEADVLAQVDTVAAAIIVARPE